MLNEKEFKNDAMMIAFDRIREAMYKKNISYSDVIKIVYCMGDVTIDEVFKFIDIDNLDNDIIISKIIEYVKSNFINKLNKITFTNDNDALEIECDGCQEIARYYNIEKINDVLSSI